MQIFWDFLKYLQQHFRKWKISTICQIKDGPPIYFKKWAFSHKKDLILQPNACVIDIETRPLAVDEGFTSCLYVCTEKTRMLPLY